MPRTALAGRVVGGALNWTSIRFEITCAAVYVFFRTESPQILRAARAKEALLFRDGDVPEWPLREHL
jgi:hypothetical protein